MLFRIVEFINIPYSFSRIVLDNILLFVDSAIPIAISLFVMLFPEIWFNSEVKVKLIPYSLFVKLLLIIKLFDEEIKPIDPSQSIILFWDILTPVEFANLIASVAASILFSTRGEEDEDH